mgnify:CR=1 FL=1
MQLAIMLQETIYLQDVLQQIKTLDASGRAVPFSIKVRTLNRYSKTGGKLHTYPQAKLVMKEENPNVNSVNSLRYKPKPKTSRRDPKHFENKTRNIKVLPQGSFVKIHIRYIIEFNNKKVIY